MEGQERGGAEPPQSAAAGTSTVLPDDWDEHLRGYLPLGVPAPDLGPRLHVPSVPAAMEKICLSPECPDIDVAFICDATYSMQQWIFAVGNQITTIASNIKMQYEAQGEVRFACVAYRDYSAAVNIQHLDFTSDLRTFQSFVRGLRVLSGGDTCEDVFSGVEKVGQLSWKEVGKSAKLVFHLGDAPCHGTRFHLFGSNPVHDQYPEGDKLGRDISELLLVLRVDRGVDTYTFSHITGTTQKMIREFRKAVESTGGGDDWIVEDQLGLNTRGQDRLMHAGLTRSVMRSVQSSVTRSTSRMLSMAPPTVPPAPPRRAMPSAGPSHHLPGAKTHLASLLAQHVAGSVQRSRGDLESPFPVATPGPHGSQVPAAHLSPEARLLALLQNQVGHSNPPHPSADLPEGGKQQLLRTSVSPQLARLIPQKGEDRGLGFNLILARGRGGGLGFRPLPQMRPPGPPPGFAAQLPVAALNPLNVGPPYLGIGISRGPAANEPPVPDPTEGWRPWASSVSWGPLAYGDTHVQGPNSGEYTSESHQGLTSLGAGERDSGCTKSDGEVEDLAGLIANMGSDPLTGEEAEMESVAASEVSTV